MDYRIVEVRREAKEKGWATTWDSLGGRWAVPGTYYRVGIARHWRGILDEEGGKVMSHVPRPPIEDLIHQTVKNKIAGVGFDWMGRPRRPSASVLHGMGGTLGSCIGYFPLPTTKALTDYGIGQTAHNGTKFARIVQFNDIKGARQGWASGPVQSPEGDGPRFLTHFGGADAVNDVGVSIEHDDSTEANGNVPRGADGKPLAQTPVTEYQWNASIWLQAWLHAEAFDKPQTADTYDWNMHHYEFCGRGYKGCPMPRIENHTAEYQGAVKHIMRHFQWGTPYPKSGIFVAGIRITTPPEGAPIVARPDLSKPTPTGHTVHRHFHAIWDLDTHGYPVLPAVDYTDGRVRQLFENAMLGAAVDGSALEAEGIGQVTLDLLGRLGLAYPDWANVHPNVAPPKA